MSILVHNLHKRFGSFHALAGVSIEAVSGKLLALLGPSGSGKTTLLRIIAGLESADCGTISFAGRDVTRLPARDRQVGFVFQQYSLFGHLSVFENIAFGLRIRHWRNADIQERVRELLSQVRLEGLEGRKPSELSGGQRQRVALARALAARPQVLLLDEPFGALDARVRLELRHWLRLLHEEAAVTTILVTHDQEEAFEVADQVVVLNAGRVEQTGSPRTLEEHPASPAVLALVSQVNVFQGRVANGIAYLGNVAVPCPDHLGATTHATQIYVRSHEVDVHRHPASNTLEATVQRVNPAGAVTRIILAPRAGGPGVRVELPRDTAHSLALRPGEASIWLRARLMSSTSSTSTRHGSQSCLEIFQIGETLRRPLQQVLAVGQQQVTYHKCPAVRLDPVPPTSPRQVMLTYPSVHLFQSIPCRSFVFNRHQEIQHALMP